MNRQDARNVKNGEACLGSAAAFFSASCCQARAGARGHGPLLEVAAFGAVVCSSCVALASH